MNFRRTKKRVQLAKPGNDICLLKSVLLPLYLLIVSRHMSQMYYMYVYEHNSLKISITELPKSKGHDLATFESDYAVQ